MERKLKLYWRPDLVIAEIQTLKDLDSYAACISRRGFRPCSRLRLRLRVNRSFLGAEITQLISYHACAS